MTPEQLREIEQRWASNEVTMQTINDFNLLLAEVRRLQEQLRCEHNAFLQAKAFAESLAQKMSLWALCKACKFHEKECDSPISDGCELWEATGNG